MKQCCKYAAALLLCALTAAQVSCGSPDAGGPAASPTESGNTTEISITDDALADSVPELNFNGADFRIFVQDTAALDASAEQDGDLINDAVYSRNRTAEERFNIKLNAFSEEAKKLVARVKSAVVAGDDIADLVMNHSVYTAAAATEKLFLNWLDIPYVDFDRPWWMQNAVDELTINGYMPLSAGDICLSITQKTYGMFFNRMLLENIKLEDPYENVRRGDWTLEKLSAAVSGAYADLNGSGAADDGDRFGLSTRTSSHSNVFMFSCDQPIIERSGGEMKLVLNTQRMNNIVSAVYGLYYGNQGTYSAKDNADANRLFASSSALFLTGFIDHATGDLRDMEAVFGIVPYPKYDEKQENYYTIAGGSHNLTGVPVTAPDTKLAGAVVEAMCVESLRSIVPVYYDIVLKVKAARDEESLEMLDLIMDGARFDFAYIYDNWMGFGFAMQDLIVNKNENFASYYESKQAAALEHYRSVAEAMR